VSWYGTHPTITKEQAKSLLPKGACKRTIYLVRCLPSFKEDAFGDSKCVFCGIEYSPKELKREMIRKGWIPGSSEFRYFPEVRT
jgi:hypothetical protein